MSLSAIRNATASAALVGVAATFGCADGQPPSTPPAPKAGAVAARIERPAGRPVVCGENHHLTVHVYDVGQALAVLVDLPDGRHVLVDTGDSPHRPDCGAWCAEKHAHLLARLREDLQGAPIDLLWITHQHSDHIGGAPEVLADFAVGAYVDNGRDGAKGETARAHRAAEQHGAAIHVVDPEHAASPLAGGGNLRLTPIVPAAWPGSCAHDPNECSIGLRVDFCASSVLLTGDAEREEEAALDPRGTVTLLQVAHHGSDTSSSPRFLAKAMPRYAVISAGAPDEGLNHDYCHPRAAIVARLTQVLDRPQARGAGAASSSRPSLRAFSGDRCDRARASDWSSVPASDHLWATERDGDVVLTTTGDGVFTRTLPQK